MKCLLAAAAAAAPSWAAALDQTYEMSGLLSEGEPAQMELTISDGASVTGHYYLEAAKRPRLLQGRLDRATGRLRLQQYDQRCTPVARFDGVLEDDVFTGSWSAAGQAPSRFVFLKEPHPVAQFEGSYRCELKKGQFVTRLELAVAKGTLGHFTYLTDFVGGKDARPWYCAINSVEPNFEAKSEAERIVLRDGTGAKACRIGISDQGHFVKVRFQGCNRYCARTALPHSLLIDKRSGTCSEFAVPAATCTPE